MNRKKFGIKNRVNKAYKCFMHNLYSVPFFFIDWFVCLFFFTSQNYFNRQILLHLHHVFFLTFFFKLFVSYKRFSPIKWEFLWIISINCLNFFFFVLFYGCYFFFFLIFGCWTGFEFKEVLFFSVCVFGKCAVGWCFISRIVMMVC